FLMLTALPVLAAATTRSVCLHRNAGICKTSRTLPAASHCDSSWMSLRRATPSLCLTSPNISSHFHTPGPRKESKEERLDLSNDDLKTNGKPSSRDMSLSAEAVL